MNLSAASVPLRITPAISTHVGAVLIGRQRTAGLLRKNPSHRVRMQHVLDHHVLLLPAAALRTRLWHVGTRLRQRHTGTSDCASGFASRGKKVDDKVAGMLVRSAWGATLVVHLLTLLAGLLGVGQEGLVRPLQAQAMHRCVACLAQCKAPC